VLGDERVAHQTKGMVGKAKSSNDRMEEYRAVALQDQGLRKEGARFAYRAQPLQQ
jgi:hypothetical protein